MVDIQPTATQPISDDQELAKVLAGVNQQTDDPLQFEETPVVDATTPASTDPAIDPALDSATTTPPATTMPPLPVAAPPIVPTQVVSDDLTPIKNDAINELRPLVDKLSLQPEEKFDTYLLLLRSTDDRSLIAPAYAAAQGITDETRKAQALLDIIKEIDYLSNPQQPAT